MSTEKEAFISSENRPHVGPDTPLAELKVRDLRDLLAGVIYTGKISDYKNWDFKNFAKDSYDEWLRKIAQDIPIQTDPRGIGPDPEFGRVVRALSGLSEQVSQLSKEVEALKKERG